MKVKTVIKVEEIEAWSEINWKVVNKSITNLRRRIFDAKREKRYKALRSLQKLMLNSKANILYSIRKISYNSGKDTPGIDKQTVKSPYERFRLYKEILNSGWQLEPKPIRRIYIKEPNKLRPIGIPTVRDRVVQVMIKNSLEPEWEAIFEKGSYGFRPFRNTNDAASRIWLTLNRENSRKWILDTDISKCFDTISHKYLLSQLKYFPGMKIIKQTLEAGIIIRDIWLASEDEGTPQGSSISPLLCNIALHGLEQEMNVIYSKKGIVSPKGRSLIRFADDLVIMCFTREDALLALEQLKEALYKRGLQISELKTRVVHISEGFDFLGFNFRMRPLRYRSINNSIIKVKENEYRIKHENIGVYVTPSIKSQKKIKSKIRNIMISSRSVNARTLIGKLNPVIKGYVQSKFHWHSNKFFKALNHYIFWLCWRWACRKHPSKGSHWIKEKYFVHLKIGYINNKWVFAGEKSSRINPLYHTSLYLYQTHWFPIRDYLVGKMDKLPDNRLDSDYYKDLYIRRLNSRDFNIFRRFDKDIIISQDGLCPICNDILFNQEKIHAHHIVPVKEGGKSNFSNLVYIHMACHYRIHKKDYDIEYKPFLIEYKRAHTRPDQKKLT